MKILTFFKIGFIGSSIALVGGLSGCVQETVVQSDYNAYPDNNRLLISSNIAYYEKYGYPAGYVKPYSRTYYQPQTVVVKKVKVVHEKVVRKVRPKVVYVMPPERSKHNLYSHHSHNRDIGYIREDRDYRPYQRWDYSETPYIKKRWHDNHDDNDRIHNRFHHDHDYERHAKQAYQHKQNRQDTVYKKIVVKRYAKPRPVINKKPPAHRGLIDAVQQEKRNRQVADNSSQPLSSSQDNHDDHSKHHRKEQ